MGTRVGFSSRERTEDFHQLEAFIFWNLPWGAQWNPEWHLQWRADVSLGGLADRSDVTAIGTIGPSLVLRREALPVSLEVGCSPTILGREKFGSKNFGMVLQFTSHAALNYDFGSHWRLSYRFQHMSNGGLDEDNPGLNLHMLGVSWRF